MVLRIVLEKWRDKMWIALGLAGYALVVVYVTSLGVAAKRGDTK